MSKKFKVQSSKFKLTLLFLLIILIYIVGKNFYRSAFFQNKDRINIVFSDEHPTYYSMGLSDNVNYDVPFFPDLVVTIPGGYGEYRLGALGKLVDLEKNPDLIKKTYSLMTSSIIDYYFYRSASSDKIKIYFGEKKENFFLPGSYLIFFGKSNAHFLDRLYVFMLFFGKTKGQFKIISNIPYDKQADGIVFSTQTFFDTYQGYFYRTTYRNEKRNVQILYSKSYSTASKISQILQGEGIRVVDLSEVNTQDRNCYVKEDNKDFSQTAKVIANFFDCKLVRSKTEAYDIILQLGKREGEWEIK